MTIPFNLFQETNLIHLYDFEDSFTYNLLSELKKNVKTSFGEIEIHHWSDLINCQTQDFNSNDLVVLGPGPGHPSEYQKTLPFIKGMISSPERSPYFLGVCLGHQLVWGSLNRDVQKLESPVHGQSITLSLPDWPFWDLSVQNQTFDVQRYNSLIVSSDFKNKTSWARGLWANQGQLWGSWFTKGLTYQFHPESVGTSCPKLFFRALNNLLYNKFDECSNRGSLRQKNN